MSEWQYTGNPKDPGWYAVLVCYDESEGVLPSSGYWNGEKWSRKSILCFGDKCNTEAEAESLAYENEP